MEDMDWTIIGERIRECRQSAGMSQGELALAVQLDRTMVAKIETGIRRVDALELARFSTALGMPLEYFLESRPRVLSRRAQQFEEGTGEVGRHSYRLEAKLFEWLRDVRQVKASGRLRPPEPLRYPGRVQSPEDARTAARWLRNELKLGSAPIPTLMRVCQDAGQLVLVADVEGEGASLVDDGLAVAVVSREPDPGRRRATAAHELGHLVLGDEYSADLGVAASRSDREAAIDAFAAELLLPAHAFGSSIPVEAVRDELIELAAVYSASWSLTIRQAIHAGAIDREHARTLRAANPTRAEIMEAVGWAPQPDLASVFVPPVYAHAVLEMWKSDQVTTVRAVELLHGEVSVDDLPRRDDTELAP